MKQGTKISFGESNPTSSIIINSTSLIKIPTDCLMFQWSRSTKLRMEEWRGEDIIKDRFEFQQIA